MAKSKIEILIEAKVRDAIKNLDKTEKELDDLGRSTKKTSQGFLNLETAVKGFVSALAIRQIALFSTETAKLAGRAIDLRRSLANLAAKEGLDVQKLMEDLRTATANTVSEIELMRSATQAKFLGLDLKNLPILFEFARKRAKDTGQDINYLVESIVTGIGRKSPLILDNLGLQMRDLREEVKKIAIEQGTWNGKVDESLMALHLQQAAVNIAQKAIKDSGTQFETAADKLAQFNAKWEDLKIILGAIATGPLSDILDIMTGILEKFGITKEMVLAQGIEKGVIIAKKNIEETKKAIDLLEQKIKQKKEDLNDIGGLLAKITENDIKKLEEEKKKLQEDLKIYEQYIKKVKEAKAEQKTDKTRPEPAPDTDAIEKAKKDAEFLKELRIRNIQDEYERRKAIIQAQYEKERELHKNNAEILAELDKWRTQELAKVEEERLSKIKKARQEEIENEKKVQDKIREIRNNAIALSIEDEYQRRLFEIEAYYQKEIELAQGNAELIAALEAEKTAKIKALQKEQAEAQAQHYLDNNFLFNALLSSMDQAYGTFINSLVQWDITGAERRKQILESAKNAFISAIGFTLKEYIKNKIKELIITKTIEGQKTAATVAGTTTRTAMAQAEVAVSGAVTAANLQEGAAKIAAEYSWIPVVGMALASALISAMVAMVMSVGKKARGGLVRREELGGFAPAGEDGVIGVQEGEYVVRKNRVTPQTLPLLEAINAGLKLPTSINIAAIPVPQPAVAQVVANNPQIIERTVPVSGKIVVETVAPDATRVREHYIKVNREVLIPDRDYVDNYLRTQKGEFD